MSRSGYTDDYEHMGLYRKEVENAVKGKRGQSFLKQLATHKNLKIYTLQNKKQEKE